MAGPRLDSRSEGLFENAARQGAVSTALPLLATYFAGGDTWKLRSQAALEPAGEEDVDLAGAIRLRVLLALGRRLIEIAAAIIDQSSSRYGHRSSVSIGAVAGRLDLTELWRSRSRVESPRRYPVRRVERHVATDENVLAVAALEALRRGLSTVPTHVLPKTGPERREIAEIQSALLRLGQLPLFASLRDEGRQLARQARLDRYQARALRRLSRREVAHPKPYVALTTWVGDFLSSGGPRPGEKTWSFYDERFDTRLFEIWLLGSIEAALTRRLGEPDDGPRPLWQREEKPRATWLTTYGKVELFFQREARGVGISGRWELPERKHRLRAVPDIVVRLTTPDRVRCLLVDAKLRRHKPLGNAGEGRLNLPSEEIYKMLGYFEHLAPDLDPVGALVYYTPGSCDSARLERPISDAVGGRLLLAGVDPGLSPESEAAADEIAAFITHLLGEPGAAAREEADRLAAEAIAMGANELEAAAARKGRLFQEIAAGFAARHPAQLETVKSTTSASFAADVWEAFDEETRRMLVSAEMYALHQRFDMDFSGPLLVLCAACERELNQRLFGYLASAHGEELDEAGQGLVPRHPTLGQGIFVLREANALRLAEEKGQEAKRAGILGSAGGSAKEKLLHLVAEHLGESGLPHKEVAHLVERLGAVNRKYRRPSAHDQAVGRSVWIEGRGAVLGPTQALSEISSVFPRGQVVDSTK